MKNLFLKICGSELIRYLFFGGCTTMFNLGTFSVLRYWGGMGRDAANFLSIAASILFAFVVNKWLVFRNDRGRVRVVLLELCRFVGMRAVTMAVEFFGLIFLTEKFIFSDIAGKIIIQIVVIILNYIISKWFVFGERAEVD